MGLGNLLFKQQMTIGLTFGGFCLAFLLELGLNRLALIPWRKSVGQHWTERARQLYPAQKSARLNLWLIPVNVGLTCYIFWPEINCFLVGTLGFAGALLASFFMSREVVSGLKFKTWLNLIVAGLLIFFIWWVVLIIAILNMPENFGWLTWVVAGVVLGILLAFNFGLGIRLLKSFGLIKPASDHLNTLVNEVAQKMGVPVIASWILSTYISNAAAFPLTRQLVFTEKILETSSDDEIKAVCAHELGHLNEPRRVLFVRLLTSLAFSPLVFVRPLSSLGQIGTNAYWMLMIGVLFIWLLGIRVARRMETRADKIAVENQADVAVYARALERLYETNQTPAVMPKRATKIHPNLYDRMLAAGVTPNYPRPEPANGLCWTSYLMFACLFLVPVTICIIREVLESITSVSIHVN